MNPKKTAGAVTVVITLRPRPYHVEVTTDDLGIKNRIEIQTWYNLTDLEFCMQEAYVKAMRKAKKRHFNPNNININPSRFWFNDIFGAGMPILVLESSGNLQNPQPQACRIFFWEKSKNIPPFDDNTPKIVLVPQMWGDRVIEACSQGKDSND
jgi:hypothetical protein